MANILRAQLVVMFFTIGTIAVPQKDVSYVLANTNVRELERLSAVYREGFRVKHEEALRVAREKDWPTEGLMYIDERGLPVYYHTTNTVAAGLTGTTNLRSTFNVQGQGMLIGEWDGGHVRTTHQDVAGRVIIGDAPYALSSHATHVGGTLIGNPPGGGNSQGMAPQAQLKSYNWDADESEMAAAGSTGMLVSNHSYGTIAGWEYDGSNDCFFGGKKWTWYGGAGQYNQNGDDYNFGRYDNTAVAFDQIARNAPFYLIVNAAGNDNSDYPDEGVTCADDVRNGEGGTYSDYDPSIHPKGDGDQSSTIATYGNAKNILTIGNLQDDLYLNPSSSRGMTDDGRIKPDLCGNGTDLYSADSGSDSEYSLKTGTSMASPNVAGSLLLLQELYNDLHGGALYMRSATLKGLAIHTAYDLSPPGPDRSYGWGLLQAHTAGNVIASSHAQGSHRIMEVPAPTGLVHTFYSDGSSPIKITMCYTDMPGTATSMHNDPTTKLVNDLDLTLVHYANGTHYPYVLNAPNGTATTGDNDKDNVEQIHLPSPGPGYYSINVVAEGTITGEQPFSILISGRQSCATAPVINHNFFPITGGGFYGSSINSSVVIYGPTEYRAHSSVRLLPGFQASGSANFRGIIMTCP